MAEGARGVGERGGGVDALEARVSVLFGDTVKAFHAFTDLQELAENLRILSLNAELVAGRAGDAGRAVRALTQYTRELVNRLAQAQTDCAAVMHDSYRFAAAGLRFIHELRLMERTVAALERQGRSLEAVSAAQAGLMASMEETVLGMVDSVEALAAQARAVESVVSASDSIATNIAIEASGAGRHEPEFRTVAQTMRDYVGQLRDMTATAGTAVRRAQDEGRAVAAACRRAHG